MGTLLQKRAAEVTVAKVRKGVKTTKGEIIREVGYSESVSLHPQKVFETEGFKEELAKLGFDSKNAKRVVGEILNGDKVENKDKLKAAEIIFKVHGDFAPEKHVTLNVTPIYGGQSVRSIQRHDGDQEDLSTHKED